MKPQNENPYPKMGEIERKIVERIPQFPIEEKIISLKEEIDILTAKLQEAKVLLKQCQPLCKKNPLLYNRIDKFLYD